MINNQNGNFPAPSSCGTPIGVPGVAVFQNDLACNNGVSINSMTTPVANLAFTLPPSLIRLNVSMALPSDTTFYVGCPELGSSAEPTICLSLALAAAGLAGTVTPFTATPGVIPNNFAHNFACYLCNSLAIADFIVRENTNDRGSSPSAVQFLNDPCNYPSLASPADFLCTAGCNNNYVLSNALMGNGGQALVFITLPAGFQGTVDICQCRTEKSAFAGCALGKNSIAQVPEVPVYAPGARF